ncbi:MULTISPECIES: hypothetical protein [unclassified Coleofasciculus]|uniref:hypothetical protein n=1 Tax=unclassified Coleofasciculus TaxID=2692782 RepID=UPI0018828DDC|nr:MULTISPECIES: hypothetical protein [unclassified Coleofasciculus]MBE9126183.1 hypothetical protein [Coleofasciculus sp. LEGE 07081]MBE9149610.1 hypothetical protein [Coleofasciculus sp. LEGE 07092]
MSESSQSGYRDSDYPFKPTLTYSKLGLVILLDFWQELGVVNRSGYDREEAGDV